MNRKNSFDLGQLDCLERKFHDYEYPKVSVVVPTFNCSETIALTLDSILVQHYPDFEVIVVDGGSTDRTLQVINSYREERIRILNHTNPLRYALLNKGVAQASGAYINVLFPGDHYLYKFSVRHVMAHALEGEKPHLAYGGTLLRDGRHVPHTIYRPLKLNLLQQGLQPTSLQACWFSADTFKKLGKFDTNLTIRGGFDFFCRFALDKEMKWTQTSRVLSDFDLSNTSRGMIYTHFQETFSVIRTYFGFKIVISWLFFHQKEWGLIVKDALRSMKIAFLGR